MQAILYGRTTLLYNFPNGDSRLISHKGFSPYLGLHLPSMHISQPYTKVQE